MDTYRLSLIHLWLDELLLDVVLKTKGFRLEGEEDFLSMLYATKFLTFSTDNWFNLACLEN